MTEDARFGRFWAAYAASTIGTWFAFDAFPLIAILVLHTGPTGVAILAAAGLAVGALVAVPLGPWIEFRRKRPVMIVLDLGRAAALLSIPAAFAFDSLSYAQLLLVAVLMGMAGIAHRAASGAYLKGIVPAVDLVAASGRLEATTWTATALGPPLGGAAIGVLGPVATVIADAASYLASAATLFSIGAGEPAPPRRDGKQRLAEILDGWRHILAHPVLWPLFLNTLLANALIMASAPLLAVLMLGRLGFAPWEYGLAFGLPCVGGLAGARLAGPLAERFGQDRVLLAAGTLRAIWPVALAFTGPGPGGLALVIAAQLGLVASAGLFNPVLAARRLQETPPDRVARVLAAWNVTGNLTTAAFMALWGVLADLAGLRVAIAVAGVLLLATPVLLPWRVERSAPFPRAVQE